MRDERVYLVHAIESIDAIQSYTVEGRDAFFADPKTQDAVIRPRICPQGAVRAEPAASSSCLPDRFPVRGRGLLRATAGLKIRLWERDSGVQGKRWRAPGKCSA